MTPTCSNCKHLIPDTDVNVATDVAFCRACHQAHKLSDLVHGIELDPNVDVTRPPPGAWYQSSGLGLTVGATHRALGSCLGALAISLFWNGIVSVFVLLALSSTLQHLGIVVPEWFPAPKMNGKPMHLGMTIFLWLFLTPFIVIGAGMIGAFLSALGGRTEVRISGMNGAVFTGVGPLGWQRRFRADAVKDVRVDTKSSRDNDGDRASKTSIVIELHDGKQMKFGSSLRTDRMLFLAAATRKAFLPHGPKAF